MENFDLGVSGSEQKIFGGRTPIWRHIDNDGIEAIGGNLKVVSDFSAEYAGKIILAGAPVNLTDRVITILPTYEVTDNYAATVATVIKVNAYGLTIVPKVGDVIMVAPATVGTTGTAIAITAVALVSNKYELTVGVAAFGSGVAVAAGAILVGATAAGSAASIATIPTGLVRREVKIATVADVANVASVYCGDIYIDRIQAIPACVKAVLPQIHFTKG